ncbi:MAG TPA: PAS domain-containing protein [Methylophilaceae bacterium]|nr:PAS domain-containing protein [Methylophilaceae bacterium]
MSSASLIEGATVLIVDDTLASLGIVVEALEDAGFRISVAEGGEEAVRRAALVHPDLILLDVMMADMDGLEVCRRLKASTATADIPVIFMTALAEASDRLAGFSAGAVDYVTKPLQIEEVVARVSAHVRLRLMQRRLEMQNEELRRYREELGQRVAERTADLAESNRLLREEISERRRVEVALSSSVQEFRTLTENAPDNIVRYDAQCRMVYVNPQMLRTAQQPAGAMLGKTPMECSPNVADSDYQDKLAEVIRTGRDDEAMLILPDIGEGLRYHHIRIVAERVPGGRIVGALAIGRDITEQRRAEQLLLNLSHSVPGMLSVYRRRPEGGGYMAYASPGICELFGLDAASVKDDIEPLLQRIHLDDFAVLKSKVNESLHHMALLLAEYRVNHPEKGEIWVESRGMPIRDADGEIIWYSYATDITERKRNEAVLHRREQEFRTLAENSPDVVARIDATGRYVYCNSQLEKAIGLPQVAIIGRQPVEIRDNDAIRRFQSKVEEVLATGRETELIHAVDINRGHRPIYDHVRFSPEFDKSGKVASVLVIGRDISTLKETERQLRTLVENIPDWVVRLDTQARYLFISPAITKAFGMSTEQFLGREVTDASLTGDPVSDTQMRDSVLMSAQEGVPAMLTMTVSDRVFDILYVPERDEFGNVVSVLGVARDITNLQSAHYELQKKEALLRSLIDSIPDLIFFKDLDSVYLGFNKAFAEYCGRSEAEMLGKSDYDFAPREVADFYRDNDRAMLESGEARHNDEWIEYPDGRRVLLDTLKTPLYGANGKVIGVIGISRDITERKRMQDEIAVREQEVRTMVENAPDAVVRYDRECRRIYVNRAYEVASDIRREDVLGTTPLDFWRLSVPAEKYMAMLRHIMDTGEEKTLTYEMVVDGSLHCQSMRLVPEYGQDGQVVSVLAIARDITDIKRMEALLRKRETEFRTLAENSPDMIVRYDPDCRRIYLNPACERYTGIRLEEVRNKTPHEVWKSLMPKEEYMERLQRVMKTGEPDQILLEWHLPDGSLTSHLMHTVAEYDNQGKPVGVLVIGHNISKLKAIERRLEESREELRALTARREEAREEERKRIAGEIHDELGQLLSVLRLNMTTLDFRFGNDNQDLREKVQKMVGTVDQAIAVVRSIASRLRPAVLSTGTIPAVEWLVQEFTASTGIVCKLFVESDDIALDEDRSMALFRIAQESLTNVLRHSGADSVEIYLRYVDDACEMTVRDNGKGFDLARADKHNTYGLVGMRERALMLGGDMEIDTSPGNGTTLKLRVPVEA